MSDSVYRDGSAEEPPPGPAQTSGPTQTLDDSGPSAGAGLSAATAGDERLIGRTVGKIRIQKVLGAGGMGQVFIGFDEKLKRTVALKSIRRHHAQSREMKARFLQEAQILSRLQHPNICQIHDYIEGDQGSDYLVLELIRGQTLKDLDTQALSFEKKLSIAVQLTEALSVAHAEGVVHRDLKPANVMMTDEGQVKILDFGIAQSILDKEVAEFLQSDALAKTPRPDDVGEEISTGEMPTRSLDDGDTVVMASEADLSDTPAVPPRAPISDPDSMESGATQVLGETEVLGETTVPADLRFRTQTGSVVGTPQSMSPEQAKGERAGSASDMYSLGLLLHELFTGNPPYTPKLSMLQLLDAVQQGRTEPVVGLGPQLTELIERMCAPASGSRPSAPDALERLRFIQEAPQRRQRKRLRYALMAALVLIAIAMAFQAFRIEQEAQRAREAAERAEREAETTGQVLDFFLSLFEASDLWEGTPDAQKGVALTVGEVLGRGLERLDQNLEDRPAIRARVLQSVGSAYLSLGQFETASDLFTESVDLHRRSGLDPSGEFDALIHLARSKKGLNHLDEAESLWQDALDLSRQQLEDNAGSSTVSEATVAGDLGSLYAEQGRFEEAETHLERALDAWQTAPEPAPGHIAAVLSELATVREQLGDFEQAETLLRRVLKDADSHWGADSLKTAYTYNRLGIVLDQQDRTEEAIDAYRRAIEISDQISGGNETPSYGSFVMNLGSAHRGLLQLEEADRQYQRTEEIFAKTLDTSHPRFGELFGNWGILQRDMGRFDDARRSMERAAEIFRTSFGEVHPSGAMCVGLIASIDLDQRRYASAEAGRRKALEIFDTLFGKDHPQSQGNRRGLARILLLQGRLDEATELLSSLKVVAEPETAATVQDGRIFLVQADLKRRLGELDDAWIWLDRARPLLILDDGDGNPLQTAVYLRLEGHLERDSGRSEEALRLYEEARTRARQVRGEDHPWWIRLLEAEAVALENLGRSQDAADKLAQSRRLSERFGVEPE